MKHAVRIACLTTLGAVGIVSARAVAAEVVGTRAAPARVWTDADFASARPLTPTITYLPAAVFDYNAAILEAATTGSAVSVAGSRGGADARHLREERTSNPLSGHGFVAEGGIETHAVGPGAAGVSPIHFTSTRTFPNSSDTTYPTRTVGKLFFRDPVANTMHVCSGSMIKKGVVLTAGHCVHNGSNRSYKDFVFVPGLRGNVRPYGTWSNWVQVRTTTAWATGGGRFPNTGDWATIVFGLDASGRRIGNYTGWLGYQTNFCVGKHLTALGYPGNLDSGVQMHRSDSQANSLGSANNCAWGTDMTQGSSGGPVVLNFQQTYTTSGSLPSENISNRVVSTVSAGTPGSMVQIGSVFNSVFDSLINATCAANAAACAP